eukprot:1159816-Pelagomonas_calceolata.AAC.5
MSPLKQQQLDLGHPQRRLAPSTCAICMTPCMLICLDDNLECKTVRFAYLTLTFHSYMQNLLHDRTGAYTLMRCTQAVINCIVAVCLAALLYAQSAS